MPKRPCFIINHRSCKVSITKQLHARGGEGKNNHHSNSKSTNSTNSTTNANHKGARAIQITSIKQQMKPKATEHLDILSISKSLVSVVKFNQHLDARWSDFPESYPWRHGDSCSNLLPHVFWKTPTIDTIESCKWIARNQNEWNPKSLLCLIHDSPGCVERVWGSLSLGAWAPWLCQIHP